jgi:hypothetical protein
VPNTPSSQLLEMGSTVRTLDKKLSQHDGASVVSRCVPVSPFPFCRRQRKIDNMRLRGPSPEGPWDPWRSS